MSNKSRKTKKKSRPGGRQSQAKDKPFIKRRTAIRLGIGGLLAVPAIVAVSAYIDKQNTLYDLSSLGQGRPALVQVHHSKCPKCRKLLSSVESVIDEFPQIDFRIASINSVEGKVFANKHNVPHISLVMLDGEGNWLNAVTGIQQPESVRLFIEESL